MSDNSEEVRLSSAPIVPVQGLARQFPDFEGALYAPNIECAAPIMFADSGEGEAEALARWDASAYN
jgi:hypothetical protein